MLEDKELMPLFGLKRKVEKEIEDVLAILASKKKGLESLNNTIAMLRGHELTAPLVPADCEPKNAKTTKKKPTTYQKYNADKILAALVDEYFTKKDIGTTRDMAQFLAWRGLCLDNRNTRKKLVQIMLESGLFEKVGTRATSEWRPATTREKAAG